MARHRRLSSSPRNLLRRRRAPASFLLPAALAALSLLLLSPLSAAGTSSDAAPPTNIAMAPPAAAAIQRPNATTTVSPFSSSLAASSPPLDPALRALASSLASPKASSVFLANARRNFTAEALAIQRQYSTQKATTATKSRTGNSSLLSLPRPSSSASSPQTSSFAASGRLPSPYGLSGAAMEQPASAAAAEAAATAYQACSVTLAADPPAATACAPVTLSARVERPAGAGPASGVVVFGDNGVALGPPTPLAADGTASVTVTSLLPGKHNLVVWYLRGNAPGASCNEGFSAPLPYSVARAPAVVTVRASPASLSAASSNGSATAQTCSLRNVAFDVAVAAPGGARDCATPGGVVALYLLRGRPSSVGSWSGPLLLQAKETVTSAAASAGKSAAPAEGGASSSSGGGGGGVAPGSGLFRSQTKKKATDALVGAATSAASSVARIFARQVQDSGSGDGGTSSSGISGGGSGGGGGGISVGGLDLGRAVASAKAAAAALSAVSGGDKKDGDDSGSSSSPSFAGLPAPLASAIATHLASQRPSSEDAREAAKTVVSAAASDDESAEIAARAIDAVAAAEAADDKRALQRERTGSASSAKPAPAAAAVAPVAAAAAATAPEKAAPAAAAAAAAATPAQTPTSGGGGGLLSHLPHLGSPPLPLLGRRRRNLQDWMADVQAAVAADPLLHRVLGAGVLLPTELAPGAPSHAALGAAKLKVGLTPPGQYTLVAQYSGDSRFEKASGIAAFDIDSSCGFFT